MKSFLKNLVLFTILLLISCENSDNEDSNIPPNVSFISPNEDLSIALGDILDILVAADDPDGQVDTVYIEFNGENIAQITSIPYQYSFNTSFETPGTYELKAIASDNLGALSTTTTILLEITEFVIVPPTVQTLPPTFIGLFGADVKSTSTSFGTFGPDQTGICWDLTPNPVFDENGSNFQFPTGTTNGISNYNINSLEPGTTYYFRAFATYYDDLDSDSIAVTYGDNIEVTLSSEFYTETGMFTDTRDGEVYQWVTIDGMTWMAENLRYSDNNTNCIEYYDDVQDGMNYGNFYRLCDVCPDGWRLPVQEDYVALINYLGGTNRAGKYLKSNNAIFWNTEFASNESLFSALPGGYKVQPDLDSFETGVGEKAYFSYLDEEDVNTNFVSLQDFNDSVEYNDIDSAAGLIWMSIRCIQE
ncbi:FISUMP domain-containing protein [uncultured Psychroserpens sp.]|uniref:FISUMP domain-containing protein n=1 Tax=uncultured Psychroserpens sp. TaxID=255436 RepID=UPI002613A6FB|nr:FISUMP domain-containing protein [uncultured Psychroserpens sp.]